MCANDKVSSIGCKTCMQTTRLHRLVERHVCKQQGYIDWLKDMYANNKVTSIGWKTCMQTTRLHRLVERHVCKQQGYIDWLKDMYANDMVSSIGWETCMQTTRFHRLVERQFEILNIKPAVAVFYSPTRVVFHVQRPTLLTCCFTSTDTVGLNYYGREPRTATSTFAQLLSSEYLSGWSVA